MSKGKFIAGLGFGIAVGTAFGFYALAPNVQGGPAGNSSSLQRELKAEKTARGYAEAGSEASDEVLKTVAESAVKGKLSDVKVLVLTTPDANPDAVEGVKKSLDSSGAKVTGTVNLTEKMLDPAGGDELKTIAANSLPAGAKLSEDKLNPGTHSGELLGAALRSGDKPASDSDRALALGALSNAKFISYTGDAPSAADVAVVITGGAKDDAAHGNYGTQFVADFAVGIDSRFAGAVLAGEQGSAEANGAVGLVRSNAKAKEELSTVDNVASPAGQITVIRALAKQKDKQTGHFGAASNAVAATTD